MSTTLVETRETVVTARDVLLHSADLLGEFGWRQGEYGSKADGRMCLVGALFEARDDLGVHHDVGERAYSALASATRGTITVWNDHPLRTKAEVVAKLREAAEATA